MKYWKHNGLSYILAINENSGKIEYTIGEDGNKELPRVENPNSSYDELLFFLKLWGFNEMSPDEIAFSYLNGFKT